MAGGEIFTGAVPNKKRTAERAERAERATAERATEPKLSKQEKADQVHACTRVLLPHISFAHAPACPHSTHSHIHRSYCAGKSAAPCSCATAARYMILRSTGEQSVKVVGCCCCWLVAPPTSISYLHPSLGHCPPVRTAYRFYGETSCSRCDAVKASGSGGDVYRDSTYGNHYDVVTLTDGRESKVRHFHCHSGCSGSRHPLSKHDTQQ